MYRIITDTSANLELELLERKGIAEIPFSFSMPEKGGDALYCPDFSAFDSKAFYDAMRSGTRVTTSQITPAQYTEKMRPLLEAGQDILFIGMSSGVSGSFQGCMIRCGSRFLYVCMLYMYVSLPFIFLFCMAFKIRAFLQKQFSIQHAPCRSSIPPFG